MRENIQHCINLSEYWIGGWEEVLQALEREHALHVDININISSIPSSSFTQPTTL